MFRYLRGSKLFGSAFLPMLCLILGVLQHSATAQIGKRLALSSTADHRKSNQNKVFHHDGAWWALAFHQNDGAWFIWKYNGTTWTRTTALDSSAGYSYDVLLDSAANKLYAFGSHEAQPRLHRLSYAGGAWTEDAEFPKQIFANFINADKANPVSLVKAQDGTLWIFRIDGGNLQTRYSVNDGKKWSRVITLKTGLNQSKGTTDAVPFHDGVNAHVGVAYGEASAPNSVFGFLRHRDGDPDTVWTDESAALTFFGTERGNNDLSLNVDGDNNIYLFTRTAGGAGSDPRNTLYRRRPNNTWIAYRVNSIAGGVAWSSPAIAIDGENDQLYLMGKNTATGRAEYKLICRGLEDSLQTATRNLLFSASADVFDHLSAPRGQLNATTNLLVTCGNLTDDDAWFNLLTIPPASPVTVSSVSLLNKRVNVNEKYTLTLMTSGCGFLKAKQGRIFLRFPGNTSVPASILSGQVQVNGVPAHTISTNPATRVITITPQIAISATDTITILFKLGAGLFNPSEPGDYQIEAWTGSQPLIAASPVYTILPSTTKIESPSVKPSVTDADSASQYRIGLRVGAQGRMHSSVSTFKVFFAHDTKVKHGSLLGTKVNGKNTTAIGDSVARQIAITVPNSLGIGNGDSVTLLIPRTALWNPSRSDSFQVQVSTSVEPAKVSSNGFVIHRGRPIAGTSNDFERQNQSKVFYHDGFWWLTAQDTSEGHHWYLWKRTGTNWTRTTQVHDLPKGRPDCVLVPKKNLVYILLPGTSTTYLTRLSYSSGSWTVDAGYPKPVVSVQEKTMNLVRASNADLWAFWIADSTLKAVRSVNDGNSWSAVINVKTGLTSLIGLTDAVAFAFEGENGVGVGYAENSHTGSIYGFLRHRNSDPVTVWTDETPSIPQFAGTDSDDHISMMAHNDEVFMVVKTDGGGPTAAKIGLFHRDTTSKWRRFPILRDNGWTRPIMAIDTTNNTLRVFGTMEEDPKIVEGKKVALGSYGALLNAPRDTVIQNLNEDFFDISSPAHLVSNATGLIIAGGNQNQGNLWYQFFSLSENAAPKAQSGSDLPPTVLHEEAPQSLDVVAYPNPFNPSTRLRFALKQAAAVSLQIFNIHGQLVKTLVDDHLQAGTHERSWHGRDQHGKVVASGVYFYRLQAGHQVKTAKLHLVK